MSDRVLIGWGGGGGRGRSPKKLFSALRASVWSQNKGGRPPGPSPGSVTAIIKATIVFVSLTQCHKDAPARKVASQAGVFRGARFSSLPTNAFSTKNNIPFPLFVGRDEKLTPPNTPAWEATRQIACVRTSARTQPGKGSSIDFSGSRISLISGSGFVILKQNQSGIRD